MKWVGNFTDGEAAKHFLKSSGEFRIAAVVFEVDLPQIGSSIHANLHVEAFAFRIVAVLRQSRGRGVLAERSNWWPTYHLCPVKPHAHLHVQRLLRLKTKISEGEYTEGGHISVNEYSMISLQFLIFRLFNK